MLSRGPHRDPWSRGKNCPRRYITPELAQAVRDRIVAV
jgi:hypothetical protein